MAWLSGADPGTRTAMADGRTFVLADPDCCRCREFGDTRLRYGLPDGDYVLRAVHPGYVLPEHVQAIEQSNECGHAVLAMVGGGKRHTSWGAGLLAGAAGDRADRYGDCLVGGAMTGAIQC